MSLPHHISPMLARIATEPFDSSEHLFEIKWDGIRCIACIESGRLRLHNRRMVEISTQYPELSGLSHLPSGCVIDGEIVVLEDGKPSFEKLQQRMHLTEPQRIAVARQRLPVTLVAFDLLYERSRSVMTSPLRARREKLKSALAGLKNDHVVVADYIEEHGLRYFAALTQAGLEGMMAKRLDSPYLPGKRSRYWLKIKSAKGEAFDVLGFVQRKKERVVSALLLGLHEGQRWIYKGNVGTGFNETQRAEFFERLNPLPKLVSPPKDGPANAVWRATGLRCRVRFFEETSAGRLRGPVFIEFE